MVKNLDPRLKRKVALIIAVADDTAHVRANSSKVTLVTAIDGSNTRLIKTPRIPFRRKKLRIAIYRHIVRHRGNRGLHKEIIPYSHSLPKRFARYNVALAVSKNRNFTIETLLQIRHVAAQAGRILECPVFRAVERIKWSG